MNRILCILAACLTLINAGAQTSYDTTLGKAKRFFDNQEWASTAAMCNFLIHERPAIPSNYARAIVAQEMMSDSLSAVSLLDEAMSHGVPLDSILSHVKALSFSIGKSPVYENFMLQASNIHPWMARPLDAYLLRYYSFRRNGPMMVAWSKRMLAGTPSSIQFLSTLADGYMLEGKTDEAVATWRRILEIDPTEYIANLNLANYYEINSQPQAALPFFVEAMRYRPTPFVADAIKRIEGR